MLAVLLLVVIPSLVAFNPGFCGLCHGSQNKTWRMSTHKNVNCADCHIQSAMLSPLGLIEKTLMKMAAMPSGSARGFAGRPQNDSCNHCHKQKRAVSPSGDLIIPHASHIKLRKLACVDCHSRMVHNTDSRVKRSRTSMVGCYRCHDGKKAPNSCGACHTEKALPEDHRQADWLDAHSAKHDTDPKYCDECHGWVADYCTECHSRKPRSHLVERWKSKHQNMKATDRWTGCGQCHGDKCDSCHAKNPFSKT